MKKGIRSLAAALCAGAMLLGQSAWAALPASYQEFKDRYQVEGRTPEGAVKLYFEAVFSYINESTRDEGAKMLRYAMHSSTPIEQAHDTFVRRLKDPYENYMFRSYAQGTSPENSYQMSPDDFTLNIVGQSQESDYLRIFLQSSGADSPRPVWVKEFDGLWYTINISSTYLRVRPPQSVVEENKNAHDADYDNPAQK